MAGFGAKVKLTVDKSSKAEFNQQINSLVKSVKISSFTTTQSAINDLVKDINAKIAAKPIAVKKIDCSAAVNDMRKQLQGMIDSLSIKNGVAITGLKDPLGAGVLGTSANAAKISIDEARAAIEKYNAQLQILKTTQSSLDSVFKLATSGNKMLLDQEALGNVKMEYDRLAISIANFRELSEQARTQTIADMRALQEHITVLMQDQDANIKAAEAERRREEAEKRASSSAKADIAEQQKRQNLLLSIRNTLDQVTNAQNSWTKARTGKTSGEYAELEKYKLELLGLIANFDKLTTAELRLGLTGIREHFKETATAIRDANENTKGLLDRFKGLAEKFSSWLGVSQVIMYALRTMRKMIIAVKELDGALTQIAIVTNTTGSALLKFANDAANAAKAIGSSVTDVIKSTETYARLGYSLSDSLQLASVTGQYANVAATTIDDATASLTSIMKAFNYSADEMEGVVDKLVKVGQEYAVSASELGVALQNGGSAMQAGGNTLEEAIALIAAGNAAVQNASSVGNALKTTTLRIRSSTAELEEMGEAVDDLVKSASTYRKEIMALSGVDIMLDENTYKSTYQILKEIASVWDQMTDIQQASLLEDLAGKRNANTIKSIITNINDLTGSYEAASNAVGTLAEANEKYMTSMEAKIGQFKAQFQEFSASVFNSELLKGVVDLGSGLLNILTVLNQIHVLLPALVATIVAVRTMDMARRAADLAGRILAAGAATDTLIASYQSLTAAQRKQVIATLEASAAFQQLSAAERKDIVDKLGLSTATTGAKVATDSLNVSLKAMLTTNPVGWIMLAISLLPSLISLFNRVHKSTKDLVESSNELKQSFADFKKETDGNIQTLKNLEDEFYRLSDGVDQYGRNISLSASDYARYRDIIAQIVGISPELIEGYDRENGYLVDKNGLLERAIELQEKEYQNELRSMTTASKLSEALAGSVATFGEALSGDVMISDTALQNSIYRLFRINDRNDIPSDMESGEFLARQIMEALGVEHIDEELEKYFNDYGYWQSTWFWRDYADRIAEDIQSGASRIIGSIDYSDVGFESRDALETAAEETRSAASEYADAQSVLEQANQDVSNQLRLVAESNEQYAKLSANAKKIVNDFVGSFGVEDISKDGKFGGKVIDEDAITNAKVQINDFIDKITPDVQRIVDLGSSLKLGISMDGSEMAVSEYRKQVRSLLRDIEDIEDEDLRLYIRTSLDIDENTESLNTDIDRAVEHLQNILVEPIDSTELNDALAHYKEVLQEAEDAGVDMAKTVYGNIDTNNRQVLDWTAENIELYRDELESLGQSADELLGSFSTIMGSSEEFDGVEIAFSPMLQTDHGAVLLSYDTIRWYIEDLIERASADGSWTNEELLALDAEGIERDGILIKNMIADIGDTAIQTGEAMHFVGDLGAVADAYEWVAEAAKDAGVSEEELARAIETGTLEELRSVKDYIDEMSISELMLTYKISADPNSMTIGELQQRIAMLGVDWSKAVDVWDFSTMIEGLGNVESSVTNLANAMETLKNGTALTVGELSQLALKYPELLKAENLFQDGTIEGQQEMLDKILETYENEYDALIDTKIAELTATNQLINDQIELENTKKNKVIEIADLESNGKLDSERDYQKLLNQLRDMEGENIVTFSDGVLSVNEDMLNKELEQTADKVEKTKPLFEAQGDMIAESNAKGLSEALESFPAYLNQLRNWARNSLSTLLGNISTNIRNAFSGVEMVGLFNGINSIGTVSAGPVRLETDVDDGVTIDGKNVDEWAAEYQKIIDARVETLTEQITTNKVIISNLEKLRGLNLRDIYGVGNGDGNNKRGGTTDSSKEVEEYIADLDEYYKALKRLESIQLKLSKINSELEYADTDEKRIELTKQLINVYEDQADALENLNELRKQTIRNGSAELEALGFQVSYNDQTNEFMIGNMEHLNELVAESQGEYESLQEATNALRKDTESLIDAMDDLNSANQDGVDSMRQLKADTKEAKQAIIDYLKAIVDVSNEIVDTFQKVNDVLHDAANEYAANGFLTIDTLQSILALGPQYLHYLEDEAGRLMITDEAINKVLAAKTEELALNQALTYVERLRMALQSDSIEDLNNLLYATTEATKSTWGFVYANLALLGLDSDQYKAALHNINAIRSLADATIRGIGQTANTVKDEFDDMQGGIDDLIKYVMDMLKQRIEDQIDALEDLKDRYAELIRLKKESLRASKEEADYQRKVSNQVKEIAKLQARIDALSLDTSREAQAKRAQLLEELAEKQDALADDQAEHAIEATEDSLDKQLKAFEDEKDAEIEELKRSISSYQKLYEMAIAYISSFTLDEWNKMLAELTDWNYEYGQNLESDIVSAWEAALAAAQRYGSFVAAMQTLPSDAESAGSDTHNDHIGDTTYDDSYSKEEGIHAIIKQMYSNSNQWHGASDQKKRELEDANYDLGNQLRTEYGIDAQRRNGVWYIGNSDVKLFEKYRQYLYHHGGIAGDDPTLKQNEIMAKLEKGEAILDKKKQDGVYHLIDFTSVIAEKLNRVMKRADIQTVFSGMKPDLGSLQDQALGTVNNSKMNSINFGDTYVYGASEEVAEKYRAIKREQANEVLSYLGIRK